MKNILRNCSLILLSLIFSSCSMTNNSSSNNFISSYESSSSTSQSEDIVTNSKFPTDLKEIPSSYYSNCENKGQLVDLYYETYESFSYENKSQKLTKHAVIYLPYNYDEGTKYNILYLMHGGYSNENTSLGTPAAPSNFKNVIDNAINNKEIEPLIIVCPTYNNTSSTDSYNFSLAMQLTRNYHNELVNDLIPAVETKYHTYAESSSKEDLIASRKHRAFGGFSMGSVTTWRTFQYVLDYFYYYIPMSCGTSLDDEEIWSSASRYNKNDYFVMMMVGTSDFSYSYDTSRASKMNNSPYFNEQTLENDGNFVLRIKEGYSHNGYATEEYTYNALSYMWKEDKFNIFTPETRINDVINDEVMKDFSKFIFPLNSSYYRGETLKDLQLTWYNNIDVNDTVNIVNYFRNETLNGNKVFYDIYTDEEKALDKTKENTGLFFFKDKKGSRFSVNCAGGGFSYVGAIHDSFPHALELSKRGYNAFVLIYRPNETYANEDLSRAISFIFQNKDELEVDTSNYSLWGGSAGGRMVARISSYGVNTKLSNQDIPKPTAAIIQYTNYRDINENGEKVATYVNVGESDSIASYLVMKERINALNALGVKTEYHSYVGLRHGFGLGRNTIADGWINDAINFWNENSK